jgi:hypothetical protein
MGVSDPTTMSEIIFACVGSITYTKCARNNINIEESPYKKLLKHIKEMKK